MTRLPLRKPRGNVLGANEYEVLNVPRCYVAQPGAQSMANGADVVSFTIVARDTDGMFNVALPTRVTCKTTGIYDVKMNVHFTPGGGGNHRQAWVRLNGGALITTGRFCYDQRAASTILGRVIASDSMALNAGDYVELITEHDNGAPLALGPLAGLFNGAELNVTMLSTI